MFLENIPGLETLINKIQDMIAGERFFFLVLYVWVNFSSLGVQCT